MKTTVLICPGIHAPALTAGFIEQVLNGSELVNQVEVLVLPASQIPPYSAPHVLHFLHQQLSHNRNPYSVPVVLIGFSAGVVGAIGAAWGWQTAGGQVQALLAIDGWGVPLTGAFPIHRLSHDYFTHWTSTLLGAGADSFYADPAVAHLELWRSPHTAHGWNFPASPTSAPTRTTAASFITALLQEYAEAKTEKD